MAIFSMWSGGSSGILRLRGELDVFRAPEIQRQFRAIEDLRFVILDLRLTTMIDATFLGQLAVLRRGNLERGGSIVLIVTHPGLLRVLRLVEFDKLFPLVATEQEAYDALERLPLRHHAASSDCRA